MSFGSFALLVHFTLITIYAWPFQVETRRIHYLAQAYTQPYFQQKWNLFIPPPNVNYYLYVKYLDREGNKQEKDIFNEILIKHQSNRFAGYGPILIAFVNSIHFVEKNALMNNRYGAIEEDQYFNILDQAIQSYLGATSDEFKVQSRRGGTKFENNKAEFLLVVDDLPSQKKRIYYSPNYFH